MAASPLFSVESHTYCHPNFRREKRRDSPSRYAAFVDGQLSALRDVLQARLKRPVDLRELDMVARSDELDVPILVMHSDDDGFVPSTASHDLARARPDLVRLEIVHRARHTKLWNHDADWFDERVLAWLTEVVRPRRASDRV